jgi:hypothetical protein
VKVYSQNGIIGVYSSKGTSMSENKPRKLYSRKNCLHTCYKGGVYALHETNELGDTVLIESEFTLDDKVYIHQQDLNTIEVTSCDKSKSEMWNSIDLDLLPRKNKAVKKKSTHEYDGMSFDEMIEASDKKRDVLKELERQKRENFIPWYTISCDVGKKAIIRFEPTYGIKTVREVNELKASFKVNEISELSPSEYQPLCDAAKERYERNNGTI